MRRLPQLLAIQLLAILLPGAAWADSRAVTVVNRSGETIRRIMISPAGAASPGENRLRSQVPPNAEARIAYSTGCKVDVRLGYDSGRTEEFLGEDACADLRVTAGQGAASSVASAPSAARPVADTPARGNGGGCGCQAAGARRWWWCRPGRAAASPGVSGGWSSPQGRCREGGAATRAGRGRCRAWRARRVPGPARGCPRR